MAGEFTSLNTVIDPQNPPVYKRGDRVKLEFVSNPSKWIRASQIAIIEYRLNKNPDIEIIRADYWGEDTITFEIEVTNAESLMTERKIIALIMAASPAYFYLSHKPALDKVPAVIAEKVRSIVEWAPLTMAGIAVIAFLILTRK